MALVVALLAAVLLIATGTQAAQEKLVYDVPECVPAVDGANVSCVWRCMGGREGAHGPLNPFLVFDVYRCDDVKDFKNGFPAHPHRGFSEIRYIQRGGLSHEDSCGNKGETRAPGAQMLKANRGIIHEELPLDVDKPNAAFRGFQVWINIPDEERNSAPGYFNTNGIPGQTLATGAHVRVIAGTYQGKTGPLTSHRPGLLFVDVESLGDQPLKIESNPAYHAVVYVYDGEIAIGSSAEDREVLREGEFAILSQGDHVLFYPTGQEVVDDAGQRRISVNPGRFVFLTAPKVNSPVFLAQGFVASSKAALDEALEDLMEGRSSHC